MAEGERPKVLSIVGPGRSGSTILAGVLGEVPGVVGAGELRWLWRRGVADGRPCGCGLPPTECPVWSEVLARVVGAEFRSDPARSERVQRAIRAQSTVAARRHRFRVLRTANRESYGWPDLDVLREITTDTCRALAEVTGCPVIVDSSKRAQEAALLAAAPGVDHYVLHLVRDPRAVAYSWGRAKKSGTDDERTMGTRTPLSSAARWNENCIGAEYLRRFVPDDRWLALRYEDFVAHPRATIDRIQAFAGFTGTSPFVSDDTVVLHGNHIVAGNPSRFRTGSVQIRVDDEWCRRMRPRDRWRVQAVTMPLMRWYRYPVTVGNGSSTS